MQHPNPDPSYFSVLIKHNPAGTKANPVSEVRITICFMYFLFFYLFRLKNVLNQWCESAPVYVMFSFCCTFD